MSVIRGIVRRLGLVSRGELRVLEDKLRKREAALEAAEREETRLEQQVASALEELRIAREALAAVEVKLDILEGAANVLDRRMRTATTAFSEDRH